MILQNRYKSIVILINVQVSISIVQKKKTSTCPDRNPDVVFIRISHLQLFIRANKNYIIGCVKITSILINFYRKFITCNKKSFALHLPDMLTLKIKEFQSRIFISFIKRTYNLICKDFAGKTNVGTYWERSGVNTSLNSFGVSDVLTTEVERSIDHPTFVLQ